jgi:prepilin-type N-terminal cleavage/methylation domain-containing protein
MRPTPPRRISANNRLPAMPRRAYTLVEMLVTTALLALVATLVAPPIMRRITGDSLSQAAEQLGQAFRDTRSQAFGRPLVLVLEPWGFSAGAQRTGIRLPEAVQVAWLRHGRAVQRLELDARGHAVDTEVVLRRAGRERRFVIDGLTGRWRAEEAP